MSSIKTVALKVQPGSKNWFLQGFEFDPRELNNILRRICFKSVLSEYKIKRDLLFVPQ